VFVRPIYDTAWGAGRRKGSAKQTENPARHLGRFIKGLVHVAVADRKEPVSPRL
jgi:hypothetical protein